MLTKLASCVISCYNEEENISALLDQIRNNNLEEHMHLTSININTGNHWTGRNLY